MILAILEMKVILKKMVSKIIWYSGDHKSILNNTHYISSWKSTGLSDETIKPYATSDNSLTPLINYLGNKIRVNINGSILRQLKISYTLEL